MFPHVQCHDIDDSVTKRTKIMRVEVKLIIVQNFRTYKYLLALKSWKICLKNVQINLKYLEELPKNLGSSVYC